MPARFACPKCHEPVSLPVDREAAAPVHCPACGAEFLSGESLPCAEAPQEAELVEEPHDATSAVDPHAVHRERMAAHWLAELGLGPAMAHDLQPTVEGEHAETFTPIHVGSSTEPDETAEHGLVAHAHWNEAAAVVPPSSAPLRVQPPKTRSPLKTLLEVVTGGVAGIVFAIYILALTLGPGFKQLWPYDVPLPGIARLTAGPERAAAAGPQAGGKTAAGKAVPAEAAKSAPAAAEVPPLASPSPPSPTPVAANQPGPGAPPVATTPQAARAKPEPRLLRPQPGSAEYLGPRLRPSFTSDQLAKALEAATKAVSRENPGVSMSPAAYETFCQLGETVTFVNGEVSDLALTDRIVAAESLLSKLGRLPDQFADLGRQAELRIVHPAAKPGILLAAVVKVVATQGRLWGATVQVAGQSRTIPVLSDQDLEAKADDKVLILGVVVQNPGVNLVGYTGTKPTVIWASILAKLP
jgi:hypothetical protein